MVESGGMWEKVVLGGNWLASDKAVAVVGDVIKPKAHQPCYSALFVLMLRLEAFHNGTQVVESGLAIDPALADKRGAYWKS